MTRKLRPLDLPVSPALREALFGLAVPTSEGTHTTVGLLVEEAMEALRRANEVLARNELVTVTARTLMKDQKRRGTPALQVCPDGTVVLRVHYEGDGKAPLSVGSLGGAGLPSLDILRQRAAEAGVDISDLGRQKRQIMARLAVPPEVPSVDPPGRLRDEVQTKPLGKVKLPPIR